MRNQTPLQLHSLSQLKPGSQVESMVSGDKFVILANYGSRAIAIESITLVTVNDHAHKDWFCASSNKPLNKLKVGNIITNKQTYVITHVSDYILHANRSVEITNPKEYLLLD
mgnify:CR=1 FL=1